MLSIRDLHIRFGAHEAVRGISFDLPAGHTLGLVGESGSGKSVTALSILRLLDPSADVRGDIFFEEKNLHTLPDAALRQVRGGHIGMVFQDPSAALNPALRCGTQVAEIIRLHHPNTSTHEAHERALHLLEQVQLADPQRIAKSYPHQLSGGEQQRVLIAHAIACGPRLLIADEPTTALDVTVQRSILDLLVRLRADLGLAVLLISHDLGVVGQLADSVAVLQNGCIVEYGPTDQVLRQPTHPYTRGLLHCRPSVARRLPRLPVLADFLAAPDAVLPSAEALIFSKNAPPPDAPIIARAEGVSVRYPSRRNWLRQPVEWREVVTDVHLQLRSGEVLGLVGESGSGKTSLAKALLERWQGPLSAGRAGSGVGMVVQHPGASLNPRMTIGEAIGEPLAVHGLVKNALEKTRKVHELLRSVGLSADLADRLPAALSGGQQQRACIARALAVQPQVLICDEVTSALDVSVQATVLNLLLDLRAARGLSLIFVSHDLSVIRQMCDRVLVMQAARVVESATTDELFARPQHPYTRQLLDAVLTLPGG
jgi:peptide/nickel transport system ATP-binding protein